VQRVAQRGFDGVRELQRGAGLAWKRLAFTSRRPGSVVRFRKFSIRINDGPNFYVLAKDLFVSRIYHFEAQRSDPVIIDAGSNIGMSILYFKDVYPAARIVGFEPDPAIFPLLHENVARNGLTDVRVLQAGLAREEGTLSFCADGKFGSCLAEHLPADATGWTRHDVPCVKLSDHLTGPVDFLKMNIEGAEWDVLDEAGERLKLVREMVIEYHHLPGLARTLHRILARLDELGFDYLINDFDPRTNPAGVPPFSLTPNTRYYLLIYARRRE
jgi:FkbM family methyltransferase